MKSPTTSSFFIFIIIPFLLLLVCDVSYGREGLEEYWEKKMEGQAMPDVIKDLVSDNQNLPSSPYAEKDDRFVRDFDIRPNVILYHTTHTHDVSKDKEMKMKRPFLNNKSLQEQNRFVMLKQKG